MTEYRDEAPGETGAPVPRDMPDQQAGADDDPWEVVSARPDGGDDPHDGAADTELPDTDEAGAGRPGAPRSGQVRPESPVPDESPA
ncbi:hypothetical protein ACIQU5_28455 [Streptomyces sp. NPDC090306]|uniref:hypothetical protein n=1 Tax=unclassified Streptomyces TaxID=2593676 RepID=UPI0036E11D72